MPYKEVMIFWLYLVQEHSHTCTLTWVPSYQTCLTYLSSTRLWSSCNLCHGSCQVSAVEIHLHYHGLQWPLSCTAQQTNQETKYFHKINRNSKESNKKLSIRHDTIPKFITLLVNLLSTTILQPDVSFKISKVPSDNKLPS